MRAAFAAWNGVRRWIATVALTLLAVTASPARADSPAAFDVVHADAAPVPGERAYPPLPPPLPGYATVKRDGDEWSYPRQAESESRELMAVFDANIGRLARELGGTPDRRMVVRVARNPEEMRALAPRDAPPPAYATGVAYPSRGVLLLSLTAPETWERPDVETVLVHELSHIALHRAVQGAFLPRWFVEGVAIHQAGERSLERTKTLWEGTARGQLASIRRLSAHFADHSKRVDLAYAQSADFVAFLLQRPDGAHDFRELLRFVREGDRFEDALQRSYDRSLDTLEDTWLRGIEDRFSALPLLIGGGGLGAAATVLLLIAAARRRRKRVAKFDEWTKQDAIAARMEAELRRREALLAANRTAPVEGRESELPVPKVLHDGESHTLH